MSWNKKIEVGGRVTTTSSYVTDMFDAGKDFSYMVQFDYDWSGGGYKNILNISLIDPNGSITVESKTLNFAPYSSGKNYKVFFKPTKDSYYILKFAVSYADTECNVFGGVYVQ